MRRRGRRVARDRFSLVVRKFRIREVRERGVRRRARERRRLRRCKACAGDPRRRTLERIERRRRRATPKIAGRAPSTRADLQVSYSENAPANSASTAPRDGLDGTKVPASGTIASEGGGLTGTVDLSASSCVRRHCSSLSMALRLHCTPRTFLNNNLAFVTSQRGFRSFFPSR